MKKIFLLFSHTLTETQTNDAKSNLSISDVISLPFYLQEKWSNVPSEIETIKEYLLPIRNFLAENSEYEDVVLIQGDFGAVYHMVNFAKELGLKTVYATTQRTIEEIVIDGKTVKKSIFEHERFREYE